MRSIRQRFIPLICLLLLTFLTGGKPTNPTGRNIQNPQVVDTELWDGNQISTWHRNNGAIVDHNVTGDSGFEWPKGSGNTAIFASGIWLAGYVNGSLRTAAAEYTREYESGPFGGNPNDPSNKIYRIYKVEVDAMQAGLSNAEFDLDNDGVAETVTIPTNDYINWPVNLGAPFVDVNEDNLYDHTIDYPDIQGDQFHWYVMNDGNPDIHTGLWATLPLDVEICVSLFGFNTGSPLENVLFVKFSIKNAGTYFLGDLFVALWSDPDLGDANDDFVGCDPESYLGFCYNDSGSDAMYGNSPPAIGYSMLQTPIISSPGDTAWVSGDTLTDFVNIPMSAFTMFKRADDDYMDPETSLEAYRYMNGLIGISGQPYIDPSTGFSSTFIMNGDPVTGTGWLDSNQFPSGDRRFLMSAGPISMVPGDTQELVAAIIIAHGTDNLSSITYLRQLVPWMQLAYKSDFEVIGPPFVFENHIVPTTTENATGPYHLEVDILVHSGFNPNENSFFVHYGIDSISSSAQLTANGSLNTYSVDVFGNGNPGMFKYYFYGEDTSGTGIYFPPGAPTGYLHFEVGNDQDPPLLENLTKIDDTIYPEGNELVKITANDRFPVDVILKHQVNNGSIHQQLMNRVEDTDDYETSLTWSDRTLGDQISYWVVAADWSTSQNTSVSDTVIIEITNSLLVGDWETRHSGSIYWYNLDNMQWDSGQSWYSPSHGRWGAINVDQYFPGMEAGWIIAAPVVGTQPDTTISGYAIDVTPFQGASLAFRYTCSVENIIAKVEIASNNVQGTTYDVLDSAILYELNWTEIGSLITTGGPNWVDFEEQELNIVDLSTPIFIRISAEGPGASTPFMIDDIFLKVTHNLGIEGSYPVPKRFSLHQNYPNPFNPTTTIQYELPQRSDVQITIYDLIGRQVAILLSETQEAGLQSVQWNATNTPSGMYFYQIRTGEFVQTRKMVLLK